MSGLARERPRERGNVAAFREPDDELGPGSFLEVIVAELASEAGRLHPNDGVDSGVVGVAALEDVGAEDLLLQLAFAPLELGLDHVAEEPLQTLRLSEGLASEELLELAPDESILGNAITAHATGSRAILGSDSP